MLAKEYILAGVQKYGTLILHQDPFKYFDGCAVWKES